ncbi:similar to Saccharomyces cerevisiae YCR045C RRT12 Probable subtilisin-family protease with a role in formation of the dityrosine layer of spore walls [Maudiozyma barnettii]|uniref:Similar to Saccharomyces cerevisiae YCR045C RRT12 Probable subtilisin-family protease with a role in formation of the dityrosine layer of spore walls n=1 Tax=Maudiozyma barnettii TaxID=61262 RepID=A0A8H2VBN9_9SACH|nr:Rrt12p [Kazachstania barnettii]CAB4252282.1 similar to Saccharomyces cerevisiae YCR045C RRT12 Probable subtilisin-family protease with a role in formation of the dityrosine layer of spore walls [Kazachstania barnettii]CAD1778983.1 similar to Saccharomyces cerevisiae YCR045C RRT12 Probable subtilisin-family protease with a role in formation of the dityrosine layer of spore walls [Kazachstania barnettii]
MKIFNITFLLVSLLATNKVIGLEYLVSLKNDETIQHCMESSISKGYSVKEFFGAKIGKTFSIGSFRGLTVELSSRELLEKLKMNPFVADIVPNIRVKAFDDEKGVTDNQINSDNVNEELKSTREVQNFVNQNYYKERYKNYEIENESGNEYDDDESENNNKDDYYSKPKVVKKQFGAPRHLARISRRSQLPFDFQNAEKYKGSFNYYYDKWNQGSDVRVYILDSGVYNNQCEFEDRVKFGHDFTGEGPGDGNGHGTHVAGIVGSKTFGVAKKVTIVDVKCLDARGQGTLITVLSAIEFAVNDCNKHPRKKCVANLSLGALKNTIINNAIRAAVEDGVVMVVAAGNFNMNACWSSPASAPEAITVGAFDDRIDTIAKFSNWGPCVDIFAPGVGIMSLSNRSYPKYISYSGTSMASPSVCGMAALLLDKGLESKDIKSKLIEMATDDIFQKRTLIFKPKTPNRVLFSGIDKEDDECNNMNYPQLDLDALIEELNEYSTSFDIKEKYSKNYNLRLDNDVLLPFQESQIKKRSVDQAI